jgi:HK97 family phage major capsid protein
LKQGFNKQEERLTMLDRKPTSRRARIWRPRPIPVRRIKKAFDAYLRSGDDDGLRGLELEGKALSTAVAATAATWSIRRPRTTVKSVLRPRASIRAIANVVNVEATTFDVLIDHTDAGPAGPPRRALWRRPTRRTLDRISIPLHELSALPKGQPASAGRQCLRRRGLAGGRIADKFARAEAAAFINGDGVDKPKGFLDHPKVESENGSGLGYIGRIAGDIADGDPIIDLVYALGAPTAPTRAS